MWFAAFDSHAIIILKLFLKISVVLTSFHGQRRTVLLANTQLTMIFFGNDHHRTYIAQYSHSEKFTNCLSFLSRQGRFFFPFFHCLTTIEISGSFFCFILQNKTENQLEFIHKLRRQKKRNGKGGDQKTRRFSSNCFKIIENHESEIIHNLKRQKLLRNQLSCDILHQKYCLKSVQQPM